MLEVRMNASLPNHVMEGTHMMPDRQLERMLGKLVRFIKTIEPLMFTKVDEVPMKKYHTTESLYSIPDESNFKDCKKGDIWEGEKTYCWFKGSYKVLSSLAGQNLYLYPHIGGYEMMMWVDGVPSGIFCSKIIVNSHGNHYCDMLKQQVTGGENIEIALEVYAHHDFPGVAPLETESQGNFTYVYESVDICTKNDEICAFYFDLKTLNQVVARLDSNNFVRSNIVAQLIEVHKVLYYDYDNVDYDTFMGAIRKAHPILQKLLKNQNSISAPSAGIIGHSHMDTAWLWHKDETLKKCTRTYANQLNLMKQYDEYKFVQSSAYHTAMVQRHYPEVFEGIKEQVINGRYEPNGGVWIESDCNLPNGEYLIRQFIWGQRYTQENFNYRSDCFWLPDTFGYSASLPQIMKGCGIKYFLTTKMDWNDTNVFPYDTFIWKGLDGSRIFVHFNRTHIWPDAASLIDYVAGGEMRGIKEKSVTNKRLIAYGFGDGGGGPQFEMIEMARRVRDLEGIPKANHTTVSEFMKELEETAIDPSIYSGELYLELHRGTLTSQHNIKRNNRLAEISLRNLEYVTVREAIRKNTIASDEKIRPLMEDMLVNQFHDILPGTSIARVHDESLAETSAIIEKSAEYIQELITPKNKSLSRTVINTLSFDRCEVVYLDYTEGLKVQGDYLQQVTADIHGNKKLAVEVMIPAFSSIVFTLEEGEPGGEAAFGLDGNQLETPLIKVTFNDQGYIESFFDKKAKRELRGEGYAFNTFLIAEDVPTAWDNWDLDVDSQYKFADSAAMISRELISNGPIEIRIRSKYQVTVKTTIIQDMVFYSDSLQVRFDTLIDWQDEHRFLKTAFDTSIFTNTAKQEIQFGYIERPTTRNNSMEKAKFEVVNHKFTDLSEARYGAALLNDCKYGISVENSSMQLSLHKGGNRPDPRGDKGLHECSYSFLPHDGSFCAKNVVHPAYQFNMKPLILEGEFQQNSLLSIEADNILVEAIKPLENNDRGFVIRMYEAEGAYTITSWNVNISFDKMEITNMLEETLESLDSNMDLVFKPFEIKTIKVSY